MSSVSKLPEATGSSSKDLNFNFAMCLVDAFGWPLGIAFFSTNTIIPLFFSHLHASNLLIGVVPALVRFGYFVPGLFVANRVSRLDRAVPWLFWVAFAERVPLFFIALLTTLLATGQTTLLLAGFLICYTVHAICLGLNQPSYWVVVGKTIPITLRGRLFGYGGLIAGILGILIDPITHYFLRGPNGGFPYGFAAVFWVGVVIQFLALPVLGFIREPPGHSDLADTEPIVRLLSDWARIWRENPGFRRFLRGQIVFGAWEIALPFYLLSCVQRFHIGARDVALFTAVSVVAGALGSLVWGAWGDRKGNKPVLLSAIACGVLAAVLSEVAGSAQVFLFVFALSSLSVSGVWLAGYNLVMEFAGGSRDIPVFTSIFNGFTSPLRVAAPLVGGFIADRWGYSPVFVIAIVVSLASLLLSLRVVEPRHHAQPHSSSF